jgi:hypothetical protein
MVTINTFIGKVGGMDRYPIKTRSDRTLRDEGFIFSYYYFPRASIVQNCVESRNGESKEKFSKLTIMQNLNMVLGNIEDSLQLLLPEVLKRVILLLYAFIHHTWKGGSKNAAYRRSNPPKNR